MVRSHVASSMAEPSSFCEPWPVTSGVATQELIATVVVVSGWNTIVGEHPLWRLFHAAYIDFRSKKQRISARWHKKKHWKSRVQIINKHCWVFFFWMSRGTKECWCPNKFVFSADWWNVIPRCVTRIYIKALKVKLRLVWCVRFERQSRHFNFKLPKEMTNFSLLLKNAHTRTHYTI